MTASDDGTFQNDLILTEMQSNWLINRIESVGRMRKKRSSLFLEQALAEKWDVRAPIPYTFDPSVG